MLFNRFILSVLYAINFCEVMSSKGSIAIIFLDSNVKRLKNCIVGNPIIKSGLHSVLTNALTTKLLFSFTNSMSKTKYLDIATVAGPKPYTLALILTYFAPALTSIFATDS